MGWEAGRLSEVSVLFADVRNYTSMTRQLGVERVAPLMDSFFHTGFDIVVRHDGILDKFIGDAIIALFNVPVRRDDHVDRSVAAATELQRAVERINSASNNDTLLQIGIGISTGFALAGRLGSNDPSSYTAIGDVVNIAARLQTNAEPGEVVVTQEVYDAVGAAFPNAQRREYQLKGIIEPVTAYILT